MTKLIDVTMPLSPALPGYPGDPGFEMTPLQTLADGAPYSYSRVALGTHTGTHVDAPAHFVPGGVTVEQLPVDILVGKCRVVEVSDRERIDRAQLEQLDLRDDIRILLKTRMSGQLHNPEFQRDHVFLTADAATYLVQAGLKLVGIDYLSIEEFGSRDFAAHRTLLGAGVVVVEGLDLSLVEPGDYDLACLPLPIVGGDGAPARVVLKKRT